jgi:hypothetical protein
LQDIRAAVEVGRVVRALKLSSQPPKAGVPFPADLALQLAAATSASLTTDAPSERWITVLEAAAFSPIRAQVIPPRPTENVTADLTKTVTRLGVLMPQIAALYGVEVDPKAPAPRPLRVQRDPKAVKSGKPAKKDVPDKKQTSGKKQESGTNDAPAKQDEPISQDVSTDHIAPVENDAPVSEKAQDAETDTVSS